MRSSSAQAGEAGETAGGTPTSVRVRTTVPLGLSARGLKIGVPPLSDDYGDPGAGVGDLDVRVGGDVPVDSVVADSRITEARLVRVDGLPVHVAPGGGADLAGNVAEHVPSGGVGVVGPNVDPLVDDVAVARGVRVEVAPLVAVRVAAVPDVLDGGFGGRRLPGASVVVLLVVVRGLAEVEVEALADADVVDAARGDDEDPRLEGPAVVETGGKPDLDVRVAEIVACLDPERAARVVHVEVGAVDEVPNCEGARDAVDPDPGGAVVVEDLLAFVVNPEKAQAVVRRVPGADGPVVVRVGEGHGGEGGGAADRKRGSRIEGHHKALAAGLVLVVGRAFDVDRKSV